MIEPRGAITVSATGTLQSGSGTIAGAVLTAGADAAKATVRSGGVSGAIICVLSAPAGETVVWSPHFCVGYTNLHVTLTGTSPSFTAFT